MSREQRRAIQEMLRRTPQGFEPRPVEQMREAFAAMMGLFPVPGDVRQSPTTLGGRPAVLVEPAGEPRLGTLLYFHGGSFALGSPQTAMVLTANLVRRVGVRAVSLDYRLAPEYPFPAAIEDCLAAYTELLDRGESADSIVLAGDSAGGGLCVTTTLRALETGLPAPAAIAAFSPGLDHTRTGATMQTKQGIDPYFTSESMGYSGDMYLDGQDPSQPLLAPAVLADLTGFPPILLQVGTDEVLLDDRPARAACSRRRGGCRSRRHGRCRARLPGVRGNARRSRRRPGAGRALPHPAPRPAPGVIPTPTGQLAAEPGTTADAGILSLVQRTRW